MTYHLALIDMPPEIQHAFDAGQISGAKAIYELRKLHGKDPDSAKALITSGEEITQVRIREATTPVKTPQTVLIEENNVPEQPLTVPVERLNSGDELTASSDSPESLASPSVIGLYQGAPVHVLFQLKPSAPGIVWIRSMDADSQQEVLADQITLSRIEEATP